MRRSSTGRKLKHILPRRLRSFDPLSLSQHLDYLRGFRSLASLCLVIQIATGVFLATHDSPHV
jgi:quinol-cytochrome oxidoreductase complex cytochrome b subunit